MFEKLPTRVYSSSFKNSETSPSLQIALGTVTSVEEAVQWLGYTFLNVRMRLNPLVYGIPNSYREVSHDCHVTVT